MFSAPTADSSMRDSFSCLLLKFRSQNPFLSKGPHGARLRRAGETKFGSFWGYLLHFLRVLQLALQI